jgi:hypothetical protein
MQGDRVRGKGSDALRRVLPYILLFPAFVSGCGNEGDNPDYVARVGSSLLTADDLLMKGGARSDSSLAARNYINEWISNELLYQEALRRNIPQSEAVQYRVEQVGKRLAIEALLDEELFQDSSGIAEEAVTTYFTEHQKEFTLSQDVALVNIALFDDRGVANDFRSGIVQGESWDQATTELQNNSEAASHLLQLSDRKYHTAETLFPAELWKVARTTNPGEVSFVVTTDAGYSVVFLHELRTVGQTPDLAYVAHEITGRLLMEGRRKKYESFIRELRTRFPVEVRPMTSISEGAEE